MTRTFSGSKFRRICFNKLVPVLLVLFIVHFLPRPRWLCGEAQLEVPTTLKVPGAPLVLSKTKTNVMDTDTDDVSRMFPLYNRGRKTSHDGAINGQATLPPAKVNAFRLQNTNWSNFGRRWMNKANGPARNVSLEQLKLQRMPDCVPLKVSPEATPTKICVHYSEDDNFISNRLRDFGEWEMELVFQLDSFFRNNPNSQLVDMGCNVGVFTLFAASLEKHVLALDILPSNLALIQLSVLVNDDYLARNKLLGSDLPVDDVGDILNHVMGARTIRPQKRFSQLITTLHNAIYSRRTTLQVYLKSWDSNLGGTEVKEINDPDLNATEPEILVDAVCLDDLLPYVKTNLSVFLKIDIEGSEPDVFLCASNFFMYVDVRVILMEILFHRHTKQGKAMTKFLLSQNMLPSEDVNGEKLLNPDPEKMHGWPENMFWVKVR
ncbi:hypothetical protein Btru_062525 [Bulinus truncatus]|nr:hypothetical protein Btru_062525 [Bulinus truncatus]